MSRVLIIGDSRRMKGGVSSVIKQIESSFIWAKYRCHWVQCQINGSLTLKLLYLLRGYIDASIRIPFYKISFFHTAVGRSMILQLPIFLYARLWNRRIVVELHVGNQITGYLDDRIFRYWINHSDIVLTLGGKWRDLLKNESWVKAEIDCLYNSVPGVVQPSVPENYFLFAAYFDRNKGYDTLIKAFAKVVNSYPVWKLIMCGTGDVDDVRKCITEAGIEDNVELAGWVEGAKKQNYFRKAYAYCMTSEKEGLPMSVLESMACGVPVISTYAGCLPEFLTDGETALMCKYGDVDALAGKMLSIIENGELRTVLSNNALALVQSRFTSDVIMPELDSIIDKLC